MGAWCWCAPASRSRTEDGCSDLIGGRLRHSLLAENRFHKRTGEEIMALRIALALGMLAAMPALAQSDDAAAQQMINDPNPSTFAVWGLTPAPKSVKDDSVQGGRSVHVATTGNGNPWDISVNVPII